MRKTDIPTNKFFVTENFFSAYNCLYSGTYFFCYKDFSVHLFACIHSMNANVYLTMLIFSSCKSRGSHMETVYTFCIQKLYKMYTTDVYKMYIYHISTSFRIHFVYKIKRTISAKFFKQNVYKSLSKCEMHFVYKHFVFILYTFCIENVYKSLSKYGIHFVYINSDLQKVYIINIMYTICIHNCMQNGSLINFNIF